MWLCLESGSFRKSQVKMRPPDWHRTNILNHFLSSVLVLSFPFFGSQDLKIRIFEAGCWVSASVMPVCRRQKQEDLDSSGKLNCMFQKEKDKQPKHKAREEERKEEE